MGRGPILPVLGGLKAYLAVWSASAKSAPGAPDPPTVDRMKGTVCSTCPGPEVGGTPWLFPTPGGIAAFCHDGFLCLRGTQAQLSRIDS